MPIVLLSFAAMIIAFVALIYLGNRILSVVVDRTITSRLEAIDQIVNQRKVPASWIAPYRKRFSRQDEVTAREAIAERAHQTCLNKLDDLMQYAERFKLADTDETKRLMLDALQEQRDAWAAQSPLAWLESALA